MYRHLWKVSCWPVLGALLLLGVSCEGPPHQSTGAREIEAPIQEVRVVLLSTNLTDAGQAEWGFAALVQAGNEVA
jgi:hypothetical protein